MTDIVLKTEASLLPQAPLSSRRYLALWFPFFPVERLRGRRESGTADEAPFVLVRQMGGAPRLAALSRAALAAGLQAGMGLADARALLPALEVAETRPRADAEDLLACALACEMFTPLVALDGQDGVMLDITGCAPLFGGEKALAEAALQRMAGFKLTARAVIADTPEEAHALARFSSASLIAAGKTAPAVKTLPVAALEVEPETITALLRAGFRTIGDVAARPSSALAARFGMPLVDRLRRLTGAEDIRITPLRPPPDISSEQHFATPFTALPRLKEELQRLACHVSRLLEERGAGGRVFEAIFFRADGAVRRFMVETAAALREPRQMARLLFLKLDHLADPIDPGFGFDALRLSVLRSDRQEEAQPTFSEPMTANGSDIADLVNRLIARFGQANVLRYVARDSHDPLRACAQIPALSETAGVRWPEPETGEPPTRPLLLFNPPEPVEVLAEVPDGPPLRFRYRRALHDIVAAEGPERIAPEWWRHEAPAVETRDYYRIEDGAGHRFWLFREGFYENEQAPRWYVHGVFA